jgi:hypothetical protein
MPKARQGLIKAHKAPDWARYAMNIFNEREKAFEDKFAHDAELEFRAAAHTAHLFGLWVAKRLALKSIEAEAYAQKMATAVIRPNSYDFLITQAEKDLKAKNITLDHHQLEQQFEYLRMIARKEIVDSK